MKSIAIVYGSTTGNTKEVAEMLKSELKDFEVSLFDVADRPFAEVASFQNIILGTSTWGVGDIQDDWEVALGDLKQANLSGKVVALFGCGNAFGYADTFVDGIGTLYGVVSGLGCKVVGHTKADGYSYSSSTAVEGDSFVGLPLDMDNEADKTKARIEAWLKVITPEFK
ncbi:MAG: flavodoxin [Bacteroidales bacterium]|nr:flavodoxin [Bacteroidales bacterium]